MLMKKNHLLMCSKICMLALTGAGAFFLTSCAKDGYDDERFDAGVYNTQLEAVKADGITITPSADGKSQTFTWPVVLGAGGYRVSLIDVDNPETPIINDSIVDGCSVTGKRDEEVYYKLSILALGDAQRGNSDATATADTTYNTFITPYATIPDGSDLFQYFSDNSLPESEEDILYYLEPNGTYSLSDVVDFSNKKVILRTASKTENATIVYGENGGLEYCGKFTLRNLNFDCKLSTKPVIAFSATPAEGILDASNNNHNQIVDATTIMDCNFTGVTGMFLYDNKVKYCLKTFVMDNCTLHLESVNMSNNSVIYIYDGGGFINDFTITNSTVWNTGESDQKYFLRYNNSGRCDRAGYTTNSINFLNNTFYNICKSGQMCNHGGFDGKATSNYDIENNIFVNCGSKQVPRRIVGRRSADADIKFAYNTYCTYDATGTASFELEGAPDTVEGAKMEYDDSKTALQTDPAFVNAEEGNFTPQGAEQLQYLTGDPRWLP